MPMFALRLALIAAVVWLGWFSVRGVTALLSRTERVERASRQELQPKLPSPVDTIRVLPPDGGWTFAGCAWRVGKSEVSTDELHARLAELAGARTPLAVDRDKHESDLVDVIRRLPLKRQEVGATAIHALDNRTGMVRVITRVHDGTERLVAGAVAFPMTADRWMLLEMESSPHGLEETRGGEFEHLLPLPATAKRVCGRWTRGDRLLLELVTLEVDGGELLRQWKRDGWTLQRSPQGQAGSFDYLCVREDRMIRAWSANLHGGQKTLLLVRVTGTSHYKNADSGGGLR